VCVCAGGCEFKREREFKREFKREREFKRQSSRDRERQRQRGTVYMYTYMVGVLIREVDVNKYLLNIPVPHRTDI
jgi:hypothetical protein